MEEKKAEKKYENKNEVIEIPLGKWLDKFRNNPWIVSTIFLAVVLIVVIVWTSVDSGTGEIVSTETAGQNVVNFINSNPSLDGQVNIVSSEQEGSLYKVTLNFQGQDVPVYTTMDGKFLISNVVPLEENTQNAQESYLSSISWEHCMQNIFSW